MNVQILKSANIYAHSVIHIFYAYTSILVYTFVCAHIGMHTYTCMCTHMNTYKYLHVFVHLHTNLHECTPVHECKFALVRIEEDLIGIHC